MEAPKVMTEYPKKKTIRWIDDETGEECGSAEYIRADAPEIVALVDASENLCIAVGMGWDLNGVIDAYKTALAAWEELTNDNAA